MCTSSVVHSRAIKVHLAVDEVVVRRRPNKPRIGARNSSNNGEIVFMVPITESYWTKIHVVGDMLRAMNDKRTPQTTSILG